MKDYKTVRKLIRRYLKFWLRYMGLLHWHIDVYYSDEIKDGRCGGTMLGETNTSWEYNTSSVTFYVNAIKELNKSEIEETVVHELIHILVNEMREEGSKHEERVVTSLQRAFIWIKNAKKVKS